MEAYLDHHTQTRLGLFSVNLPFLSKPKAQPEQGQSHFLFVPHSISRTYHCVNNKVACQMNDILDNEKKCTLSEIQN
jgi:hypothetical protein